MKAFGEVLDWADQLPVEEQETLISILQRRAIERRRKVLVESVKRSRQEFKEGRCRPASPHAILKKVMA